MKASLRVLVLMFGVTGVRTISFAESGWFLQNPMPTGNDLHAVAAPEPSTVVAVGELGTILRTTDGGATWTLPSSETTADLIGVCFVDANIGTAVGGFYDLPPMAQRVIVRTTDGGVTWTRQLSERGDILRAVSFADANTGTVVGDYGTILRTTDGGAT